MLHVNRSSSGLRSAGTRLKMPRSGIPPRGPVGLTGTTNSGGAREERPEERLRESERTGVSRRERGESRGEVGGADPFKGRSRDEGRATSGEDAGLMQASVRRSGLMGVPAESYAPMGYHVRSRGDFRGTTPTAGSTHAEEKQSCAGAHLQPSSAGAPVPAHHATTLHHPTTAVQNHATTTTSTTGASAPPPHHHPPPKTSNTSAQPAITVLPSAEPELPSVGVRFDVRQFLGAGGEGAVYEAIDTTTNTACALKIGNRADKGKGFEKELSIYAHLSRYEPIRGVPSLIASRITANSPILIGPDHVVHKPWGLKKQEDKADRGEGDGCSDAAASGAKPAIPDLRGPLGKKK